MSSGRYIELQVTSHFSFLRGASSCEDLFEQAILPCVPGLPHLRCWLCLTLTTA